MPCVMTHSKGQETDQTATVVPTQCNHSQSWICRVLTLHNSCCIGPTEIMCPTGMQLALEAVGWLGRGACGCHVLPPQQLLAPR
jgi:hypothetical protein